MKQLINKAHCCLKSVPVPQIKLCSVLAIGLTLLLASCKKDVASTVEKEENLATENAQGGNVVNAYSNLPAQTRMELLQARAATARYLNFQNAIRDGYEDISVVVPNMGYHFLNPSLTADGIFDPRKPEILVYNMHPGGHMELVAVEYAIPLNLPMPEGFTGNHDVWDGQSGFPLWLLHAWVWKYNPLGVFNPTNPDVHLH